MSIVISAPRQAHNREGNERYTIDLVVAEEKAIFDMLDRADPRFTPSRPPTSQDRLRDSQTRSSFCVQGKWIPSTTGG